MARRDGRRDTREIVWFDHSAGALHRCPGSGAFLSGETAPLPAGDWRGRCPVCALELTLGYAGYVPEHGATVPALTAEPLASAR